MSLIMTSNFQTFGEQFLQGTEQALGPALVPILAQQTPLSTASTSGTCSWYDIPCLLKHGALNIGFVIFGSLLVLGGLYMIIQAPIVQEGVTALALSH